MILDLADTFAISSGLIQVRPQVPYIIGKLRFTRFFCTQYLWDTLKYMVTAKLQSSFIDFKKVPLGESIWSHFLGEYGLPTYLI